MPLEFSPGEAWNYSLQTDVIGYLVGKISGQPFEQFLKERIFKPLGMNDTDFHVPADRLGRIASLRPEAPMTLQTVSSISKDMVQAAKGDIIEGNLYSCDVGAFNNDSFVYIAAFGLFTDVSYETDQHMKNILGHLHTCWRDPNGSGMCRRTGLKSRQTGKPLEGEYIYGMVTNAKSVGGFKPAGTGCTPG